MARQKQAVQRRKGFTLAELLVVIIIIVLLVGLLMPALNGAYKMAMRSADASLLHMIATGCEMYQQAFNEYPPSGWSSDFTAINDPVNVWPPPYAGPMTSIFGPPASKWPDTSRPWLTGSAKVFACLSGFNAIGCWDPTNPSAWNPGGWSSSSPSGNPCGALTYRGIVTHANPADNGTSEDKVYGPYYNPNDKGQTTTNVSWSGNAGQQVVFASRFSRQSSGVAALDGKPAPILYYRASVGSGKSAPWDVFACEDNFPITDPGKAFPAAADRWKHPLYAPVDGIDPTIAPPNPPYYDADKNGLRDFGISMRLDKTETSIDPATAKFPRVPYNATSFILISPGPDGEYFTSDDVTNFQ